MRYRWRNIFDHAYTEKKREKNGEEGRETL